MTTKPREAEASRGKKSRCFSMKTLLLFAAIILFASTACAAIDANTLQSMTPQQLQAYIQSLQQPAQPQQSILTIQADDQLRQDLLLIKTELIKLKESNQRMEDRFGKLVTDTDQKIQESEKRSIDRTKSNMIDLLEIQDTNFKEYVQMFTNPLRINLPIIGVLLMFTGAFLFWASKQYRLLEGVRK